MNSFDLNAAHRATRIETAEDRIRRLARLGRHTAKIPSVGVRPPNAALPPHLDKPIWSPQPDGSWAPAMPPRPSQEVPAQFAPLPPPGRDQGRRRPRFTGFTAEGKTWLPGHGWVPNDSPLVRKMEQDMELERQRFDMEREQAERQARPGAELRAWLVNRLGGGQ